MLYPNPMFLIWLMDQEDRDDEIGALRALLYKDYNNGCLSSLTDLKEMGVHFLVKHPDRYMDVISMFSSALKTYDQPLDR